MSCIGKTSDLGFSDIFWRAKNGWWILLNLKSCYCVECNNIYSDFRHLTPSHLFCVASFPKNGPKGDSCMPWHQVIFDYVFFPDLMEPNLTEFTCLWTCWFELTASMQIVAVILESGEVLRDYGTRQENFKIVKDKSKWQGWMFLHSWNIIYLSRYLQLIQLVQHFVPKLVNSCIV